MRIHGATLLLNYVDIRTVLTIYNAMWFSVFKYLPSAHNVQEVSEVDYMICNGLNPIAMYESGNDIVTLPKPGVHFYICGFIGHCDKGGMKLKATVVSPSAPIGINSSSPMPSPTPTTSPELPSPMTSIIRNCRVEIRGLTVDNMIMGIVTEHQPLLRLQFLSQVDIHVQLFLSCLYALSHFSYY